MKPLIVLISVFVISVLALKVFRGEYHLPLAGRIALSAMLLLTASGHFIFPKGMSMMVPGFIPFKTELIYLTGVFEIVAAIGLFVPSFRILTGWFLIAFLVLMLPANIYASINHINYQSGTFDGPGLSYLWFRIPLQILFIAWTYFAAIKY